MVNRSEAFAFRIAMIRLFTALEIPELIRSQLTALQSGPLGVRWIAPENFHVTVAFVGEISTSAPAHVLDGELRDVRAPGFEIELKGAGEFGGRKPHSPVGAGRAERGPDAFSSSGIRRRCAGRGSRPSRGATCRT